MPQKEGDRVMETFSSDEEGGDDDDMQQDDEGGADGEDMEESSSGEEDDESGDEGEGGAGKEGELLSIARKVIAGLSTSKSNGGKLCQAVQTLRGALHSLRTLGGKEVKEVENGLRQAWSMVAEGFMLQPEQYLAWVYDETSTSDAPAVESAFESAIKSWPSAARLWLAYLAWLQDQGRPPAKMREIFERAVTGAGTAVKGGDKIWKAYRAYEQALVPQSGNKKEEKQAKEKVLKLYRRQLSLPLEGNDAVLRELEEQKDALGCDASTLKTAKSLHNDAGKLLEKRQIKEEELAGSGAVTSGEERSRIVTLWQEYVALEEAEGQVARVPGVYERALASCWAPVVASKQAEEGEMDGAVEGLGQGMIIQSWTEAEPLWVKYWDMLISKLKKPDLALSLAQRGVKMCPWSMDLWTRLIRSLERTGAESAQVDQAAQTALETGMLGAEGCLEVLLAHIDYNRRRLARQEAGVEQLRGAFDYAEGLVASMYPEWEAAAMKLGVYRARVETEVEAARQVWERLVRGPLGRYSQLWVDYVAWCRTKGGGIKEARLVFKKALGSRGLDYSEPICDLWLSAEREDGSTLDEYEEALARVTVVRNKALQAYYQEQQHAAREPSNEGDHGSEKKGKASRKRAAPGAGLQGEGGEAVAEEAEQVQSKKAKTGQAPPIDPVEDGKRRVFVKHICETLAAEDVESELVRLFGPIKTVKLKTNKEGKSRGMADVVFATEEGAHAAVAGSRVTYMSKGSSEQPLSITPFDSHYTVGKGSGSTRNDDEHKPDSKGGDQPVHPTTIFVGNLAEKVTEEALKELFEAKCGPVEGINVVKDKKTNQPKGFALIQFMSAETVAVAMALPEQDPDSLKSLAKPSKGRGHLKVKISTSRYPAVTPASTHHGHGSEREGGPTGPATSSEDGGGAAIPSAPAPPKKPASTAPLLFAPPRALQRGQGKASRLDVGGAKTASKAAPEAEKEGGEKAPSKAPAGALSNKDFAAMFLKPSGK